MSLPILVITAVLYAGAGYTLLPDRPWMCLAFVLWGMANVAVGMDSLK